MKIILTTFLFFCLTLTTILAQGVVTTNISAPNSSGLSTHSVDDFDVNSDGTILNNSAVDGTATLGSTAVTGNSNIPAGGEASLILFQVTGSGGSDLDGTIEVFGGEAGLIIANPNGISCDGCAFTNVNRVDLVTGSGYTASTDTFSTIAATDITVEGDALELSNVDLNIQTGADFINSTTIDAETVTIEVTNFANDIANTGTISATSLNLILTEYFQTSATSFNGFSFRNLALTTDNSFVNFTTFDLDNLTINAGVYFDVYADITADSLTITTGGNFNNTEPINVTSFTATVGQYFQNNGEVINATSFTATVAEDFNNNSSSVINATNFTVTAKNFHNRSIINADSFTVTLEDNFNTYSSTTINADTVTIEVPNFADDISNAAPISADSLNFILTDDFTHESDSFTGFTNFSNLTVSTDGAFTNNSAIDLTGNLVITTDGAFTNNDTIDLDGNLTITANSFDNSGGVLISDALALSLAGDFNYEGTITANAYNFNIGGDFSYNDSANDFVLGVNDILTVSGEASIDVAGFENSGNITITDSRKFYR